MALAFEPEILPEATGLRLCKMVGDDLRLSESVQFTKGRPSVLCVLNRASISGHVGGGIAETTDYWADQLDCSGDVIGEIGLDRESWNALKNTWMRCRMMGSV